MIQSFDEHSMSGFGEHDKPLDVRSQKLSDGPIHPTEGLKVRWVVFWNPVVMK